MDQTLLKQTRFNSDNDNYNKVMILKTKYSFKDKVQACWCFAALPSAVMYCFAALEFLQRQISPKKLGTWPWHPWGPRCDAFCGFFLHVDLTKSTELRNTCEKELRNTYEK